MFAAIVSPTKAPLMLPPILQLHCLLAMNSGIVPENKWRNSLSKRRSCLLRLIRSSSLDNITKTGHRKFGATCRTRQFRFSFKCHPGTTFPRIPACHTTVYQRSLLNTVARTPQCVWLENLREKCKQHTWDRLFYYYGDGVVKKVHWKNFVLVYLQLSCCCSVERWFDVRCWVSESPLDIKSLFTFWGKHVRHPSRRPLPVRRNLYSLIHLSPLQMQRHQMKSTKNVMLMPHYRSRRFHCDADSLRYFVIIIIILFNDCHGGFSRF